MKKFLAIALAALMLFSLAACGGNTNEPKEVVKIVDINLTEEEYAFGVDKNQPELLEAANVFLDRIMSDGTFDEICNKYSLGEPTPIESAEEDPSKDQLVVATNAAFPPFEYVKGNSFYGIDLEVASLLAQELGKELVIKDMKFEAVLLSVGEHKCDIAMAGLTVTESRKETIDFTKPYYTSYQKLIVKADDTTFDNCTDAASIDAIFNASEGKMTVGFQNSTTANFYVKGDADWGFDGLNVTAKGYDNGALAVQDLINGNIDAVIIDADPATRIVQNYNSMS